MSQQPAFEAFNPAGDPRLIFLCDHAANRLPPELGTLGLPEALLATHIAWDIGAAVVTRSMALAMGAPAILGTHSRLLIDLNRGEDDPTLVMKLSDGAIIPGNAAVDDAECERRLQHYYRPYHEAVAGLIARATRAGTPPVLVSIHSFTPSWKGRARPWQVGVLWSRRDARLAAPMLELLRAEPDLCVGDNEPYTGELEGDCMARHALANGLAHVLIEIRQDLIADDTGARAWAARLGPLLQRAIAGMKTA